MNIGRNDIIWNYLATFLKIANASMLLPFILKKMPAEMVGIWSIFVTISSFIVLMDFGFSPSFTRNVTYIFSGVKSLKSTGYEVLSEVNPVIDYGLLKGLISSMKYFYRRVALIALFILLTLGTFYISTILKTYKGSHTEIYICWILLSVITCYNLYTLYYDSLIQGKGMIMKDKQVNILGQVIYLAISITLILLGYRILSIIIAQTVSVIVMRFLLYRIFFTKEIKEKLENSESKSQNDILKIIYPNAVKIGLTSLGGILVTRSSLIIGSLYLSLNEIASYGISMQLVSVIAGLASIYIATFQPKIVHLRVEHNNKAIFRIYKKAILVMLLTYCVGGIGLCFIAPFFLDLIGSQTSLMPVFLLIIALICSLVETNVSMSGTILLTKNYVPFFKASLISGLAIVLLLFLYSKIWSLGLLTMMLIPLTVNLLYQGWKWPLTAYLDLKNK